LNMSLWCVNPRWSFFAWLLLRESRTAVFKLHCYGWLNRTAGKFGCAAGRRLIESKGNGFLTGNQLRTPRLATDVRCLCLQERAVRRAGRCHPLPRHASGTSHHNQKDWRREPCLNALETRQLINGHGNYREERSHKHSSKIKRP